MATEQEIFEGAQRDNLLRDVTNEVVQEHIITMELDRRGNLKPNKDVNNVTETVRLDYQDDTWETWSGLTSYNASESGQNIQATYTTGIYGDKQVVRPDKLRIFKNNKNKVYDLVNESLAELFGRAADNWFIEIRSGDGAALNSGKGNRIIGFQTLVPDTTTAASGNGIAYSGRPNYTPVVIDATTGPGGSFAADRVIMLGALGSKLTYMVGGKTMSPSMGFCRREIILDLMDEQYDKIAPSVEDASATASLGRTTQKFIAPGGIPVHMDDGVAANVIEYWNFDAMEVWLPGQRLFELHEHDAGGVYYGAPPVFELNTYACVKWTHPRAFGKLTTATASFTITLS